MDVFEAKKNEADDKLQTACTPKQTLYMLTQVRTQARLFDHHPAGPLSVGPTRRSPAFTSVGTWSALGEFGGSRSNERTNADFCSKRIKATEHIRPLGIDAVVNCGRQSVFLAFRPVREAKLFSYASFELEHPWGLWAVLRRVETFGEDSFQPPSASRSGVH